MNPPRKDEELSREELIVLVAEQRETISAQQQQIAALQAKIEELERRSKRQAAPFSKGKPVEHPKSPGRKKGEGPFTYRQAPSEEEWSEAPIDVKVASPICPSCGGVLEEVRTEIATVTEMPEVIRPTVKAYRVSVCRCQTCGKPVRGQHPDLAPDQYGATAHRLGPRLKAAAHTLHYNVGVPVRKVPTVLEELCGVSVTQSALTQDALKLAEPPVAKASENGSENGSSLQPGGKIGEAYAHLREQVKASPIVNTDDTGWRIGGETAFLMTFDTGNATVYQIRRQHRNIEVRELIPAGYGGVMGCDRGKSYDAKQLSGLQQQKCLGHIERSLADELEGRQGPDREFPETLKALLHQSLLLWKEFQSGTIDRSRYDEDGDRLRTEVTIHLLTEKLRLTREAPEPKSRSEIDRANARILDQIGWHHTIGNLLRFLDDPTIEPTNNRAERALRPAVIARKVSHCSKTERGAEAFGAFVSVIQTLVKSGGATVEKLARVMLFGRSALPGHSPPAPA